MDDLKDAIKVLVQTLEHVFEVVSTLSQNASGTQERISQLIRIVEKIVDQHHNNALETSAIADAVSVLVVKLVESGGISSEVAKDILQKIPSGGTLIGGEDGGH